MKFTNLNPPCQKSSVETKVWVGKQVPGQVPRERTAGYMPISTLLTFILSHAGLFQNFWDHTQPFPNNMRGDSQMNAFLDLNRNGKRGYETHKSICEPSCWLHSPFSALAQRHISFESVTIRVTNAKAGGFQISQQPLSRFSCVSTSPGLLGKAGSRCEVPVY